MAQIVSKLASDTQYCTYKKNKMGVLVLDKGVVINGGAGVNQSGSKSGTKDYATTEVSKEELELLKTIPAFNKHVEDGFVKVVAYEAQAKKAVEGMAETTPENTGKQLSPKDFKKKKKDEE